MPTTIEELKERRKWLNEQKKIEEANNGDSFQLFMIKEELLDVNAKLRSMTAGHRVGNKSISKDGAGHTIDKLLYKQWMESQAEDDDVCNEHDILKQVLANSKDILTDKQHQYLWDWASGLTLAQIGEKYGVNKSVISRTIQRGRRRLQEYADKSTQFANGDVVEYSLSDKEIAQAILKIVTPKQATYLYLYYAEWLSLREIADLVGVAHTVVLRSIHRAIAKIGKYLPDSNSDVVFTNVADLDDMIYNIYQTMSADELVPESEMEILNKVNSKPKKKYVYERNIPSKSDLPHISIQREDGGVVEPVYTNKYALFHGGGVQHGKLLSELMRIRFALPKKPSIGSIIEQIFKRIKERLIISKKKRMDYLKRA